MQQTGSVEYITSEGDTWDMLSLQAYDEERLASHIIKANPHLSDIIVFEAGQKITIPVFDTVTKSEDVAPWRR